MLGWYELRCHSPHFSGRQQESGSNQSKRCIHNAKAWWWRSQSYTSTLNLIHHIQSSILATPPPRGSPARIWTARIPDKSFPVTNLSAVSLIQVNSEAGGCAVGSVPQFGAGLGRIPRWLLDAITFSGYIPGGGGKTHIGLLAANPSKEHIVVSLANDSTQTQKAKGVERDISTQLN